MNQHTCLLCLGSNYNRLSNMEAARNALTKHFSMLYFSEEMETEAIGSKFLSPFSNQLACFNTCMSKEEIKSMLKEIERLNGRQPEDKESGIVKLDIDILIYDNLILKREDLQRDYIQKGMNQLRSYFDFPCSF